MSGHRIPLPGLGGEHVAVVDEADAILVAGYHWYAARRNRTIYAVANVYVNGKHALIYMHRVIIRDVKQIDHRDGDGLNNKRGNLRPATHQHNSANCSRHSDSPWRYKGVRNRPEKGKTTGRSWQARIRVDGKDIHIGYYSSDTEAALAYNNEAMIRFGDFAKINILIPEDIQV